MQPLSRTSLPVRLITNRHKLVKDRGDVTYKLIYVDQNTCDIHISNHGLTEFPSELSIVIYSLDERSSIETHITPPSILVPHRSVQLKVPFMLCSTVD